MHRDGFRNRNRGVIAIGRFWILSFAGMTENNSTDRQRVSL
jgi:hypothetical protein